ncbi:MAG: hypothetical protein J6S09_06290 [Paludibacteraceae bacterium]|nr:hypothetical protein [Paludibacteraceae bacterium]
MLVASDTIPPTKQWMDEHPKEVGFSWGASVTLTSNYIWRGLYVAGPSLQADATVSYGGFFANMWWNVGATDWAFTGFNPEVDISIGFSRWGLSVYYIHMYYFDCYADGTHSRFFDFQNHEPNGGGTTGEWRVAYCVSDRLPLSVLVGVRTFGRDGYNVEVTGENGNVETELKRAYSTYIELGYDFDLGADWQLAARLGMTPAKSLYTGFQGDFAVTLVGLKLNKSWTLSYGTMSAFAHVMLQPWQVSKDNLIMPIVEAGNQKLNFAVGCSYEIQ